MNYASPRHPLRLSRRAQFGWDSRGVRQEEGYSEEEALLGSVGAELISGRYFYLRSFNLQRRRVTCRAGTYPFDRRESEVPFQAQLQPSHR